MTYRVVVLAEAEGPLRPEPIAPSTQAQVFGVGHLFVDSARLITTVDETVSSQVQGAGKAVTVPARAAGAVSAARSVHKIKRQHDEPTGRPRHG